MLEQIRKLFESLSTKQKIGIGAGTLVVAASLVWFVRWNRERDFALLYSNLSAEDASAVVTKLKESATDYRLSSDGTAIRVPNARIPELRLQMASAGIPKTGRIGFELFDRNNFGVTEFTEQVNYYRALEGEIERTVATIAEVEQARVHISPAKDSVFLDHRRPAKASVLLKLRAEKQLARNNAIAIAQLVSNAVEGLNPQAVSILDIHGNVLNKEKKDGGEDEVNTARIEYRRNIERDMLAKVNSTLEPLLGPDRFRAAVSVEIDHSTAEQSEESFDPAKSVMTTSQRQEDVTAAVTPSGVPGVPTNLPRPTARPGTAGSGPITRRSENINYQTSRLVKRTHVPQGVVRRISVGVLLDHNVRWETQNGKPKAVASAPTPEQLKAARDVVAGAVGIEADRGDQIVVEALPFEQTLALVNPKPAPVAAAPADPVTWLKQAVEKRDPLVLGGIGAILLVLIAIIVLVLRSRKKAAVEVTLNAQQSVEGGLEAKAVTDGSSEAESEPGAGAADAAAELAPAGPTLADRFEMQLSAEMMERQKREAEQESEILNALHTTLKLPSAATKKSEVLAKHLGEECRKNPEGIAQIVRTWMGDND